jgi:hypothetical protein
MKVKFCSHGTGIQSRGSRQDTPLVHINCAFFYIKKWYDLHGLNPTVEWLYPGLVQLDTTETIIQNIINEKPDVLGLGLYIWNHELQFHIAQKVKQQLPSTIIVLGGPELSVHKETEYENHFFTQHPYVDYVVYGDGEKAFQQIIDYHSGFYQNKNTFVNIIENQHGKKTIYPYEIIDDELYLNQSPFLSEESLMKTIRDDLVAKGIPRNAQKYAIEFARGCMYSCTFCDWSQNLTKKVKRRTHNWKDDIDLFWRLDVPIRETDANFGQWSDDIEAFDYACSLYDPNRNFSFVPVNTPKLKKHVTEYLLYKNCTVYDNAHYTPTISLQDIDPDVLNAINRPSVPWAGIVEMINNLKAKLSPQHFQNLKTENIIGLPEQTLDKIVNSVQALFELGVTKHYYHLWHLLANSPAADVTYQKIWGLQLHDVYQLTGVNQLLSLDLEETYKYFADTSNQRNSEYFDNFRKYILFTGHKKMSLSELWTAKIFLKKWDQLNLQENTVEKYNSIQIKKVMKQLLLQSMIESKHQYNTHQKHISKYGIIIWGHYDTNTKILYSDF